VLEAVRNNKWIFGVVAKLIGQDLEASLQPRVFPTYNFTTWNQTCLSAPLVPIVVSNSIEPARISYLLNITVDKLMGVDPKACTLFTSYSAAGSDYRQFVDSD